MELFYIQQVLAGDIAQFNYFVKTYQDMAYAVALSITRERADAEDAVQDAFVKAYQSLASFRQDAKFSTWFYRIVVNTALTKIKKSKTARGRYVAVADVPEALMEQTAAAYKNLAQAEQQHYIRLAMAELNGEDCLLLTLYYLHEHSLEEITQITNLAAANVKMKLHRARRKMYEVLHTLLRAEKKNIL